MKNKQTKEKKSCQIKTKENTAKAENLLDLRMGVHGVSSRFVPMDLSHPDDSYPGSDTLYPTLWTIRINK